MKYYLILIILLVTSSNLFCAPYMLTIKQQTIQTQIEKSMPVEKSNLIGKAIINNPLLALNGQLNQIEFWVDFDALIFKKFQAIGKSKVSAKLFYDHDEGEFYLRKTVIEELIMDNVKDKHIPIFKKLLHVVVKSSLKKNPIFTLDEKDQKQKFAKASIKSVAIVDEALIVVMNMGL
ncbi:DUF1439 domain-containing protein [Marinicellulosiphila megalodicopiae]|uniref:DUF1439 domain-containing protein n=1 Tax=Marinicellulosiphila megalodicopiae TaxID=2724896 RepID=UPI003BB1B14E